MLKSVILFLSVCLLFSCSPNKKLSEDEVSDVNKQAARDTTANYFLLEYIDGFTAEDYYTKLDSIKNGLTEDFFSLRMAYTKISDFNPYDTDISTIHKSIVSAIDSFKYDYALELAESILNYNYVDLKVHMFCGYIYKQLNDTLNSNYHYWCYEGLVNSILQSGDGRSAKTAFIVITTKEEYGLLNWFNLQFIEQSLVSEDGHSFDILKAKDTEVNEQYDIYFNIDIPFAIMSKMFDSD